MGARFRWFGWAVALAMSATAHAQQMQIQFAEKVAIPAPVATTRFEAYGRQFVANLEDNQRLIAGLPSTRKASLSTIKLLRGTLDGVPGSWVRLSAKGGRTAGAIWDGADLYIVARHDEIARFLTNPLAADPAQTVIFKLSDTRDLLPANFCATFSAGNQPRSSNGLAQYKALVDELKIQFTAMPTDQLDIAMVADSGLQQIYSSPNDDINLAMLNTLNVVDGIYDAQISLMVSASVIELVPAANDPLTATDSSQLLGQLATYRSTVPAVQAKPLAHLFSSRELDGGTTLGIAHLGGACSAADGVSLTHIDPGGFSTTSALVMAHELGHNLGAQHDTASCGNTFLMWPEYSDNTTARFSQCSIDAIKPFVVAHRGSCITSPVYADVSARVGVLPNQLRAEPFVWPVYVQSVGTDAATHVIVSVSAPGSETPTSITPAQGTCAPLNGWPVSCDLGTVAAGAQVQIDLGMPAQFIGDDHIFVSADAANDRYDTNNQASGTVHIDPPATLSLSIDPASRNAQVGDTVSYTATVVSNGPRAARNVKVMLGGGAYFYNTALTASQGNCFVSFNGAECHLGDMPAGTTARVTLDGHATQGVDMTIGVTTSSDNALTNPQTASSALHATATRDLQLDVSTGLRLAVVGAPYDLSFQIRANGTQTITDGKFRLNSGGAAQSVTIDGTPCTNYQVPLGDGCPLGTMQPGDVRQVVVQLLFNEARASNVYVTADTSNDELWSNNDANLLFQPNVGVDVGITTMPVNAQIEGQEQIASATITSLGTNEATNVSAQLDVPAGLRIVSATLPNGTCALSGDRRVVCTRPTLAHGQSAQMDTHVMGDLPALYTISFTAGALNDGVSGNNTATAALNVRSIADASIQPFPSNIVLITGTPRTVTFNVVTGPTRTVHGVRVSVPSGEPNFTLNSLSSPGHSCTVDHANRDFHCDLGDVAPNATVPVSMQFIATQAYGGSSAWVRVDSLDDSNSNNDLFSVNINTYPPGDAAVSVASASISGDQGATITLPRITLTTLARIDGLSVDIPMPTFATVTSISAGNMLCSGTSTLQCYVGSRDTGATDSIDITLKLDAAGTFTSALQIHAINDINPANDTASLQVQSLVPPPPPPPPPPPSNSGGGSSSSGGGSSGGGGGGRLEWMGLALLAMLAFRRANRGYRRV